MEGYMAHPPPLAPLEYDHEFFGLASVLKKIHKCDNATSPCCADLHFVENSPSLKVSRATNRSPLINACSKFLKYQPLWYWLIFWYWHFGIGSYFGIGIFVMAHIPMVLTNKNGKLLGFGGFHLCCPANHSNHLTDS